MKKRIMSIILAFVMIATMLPFAAFTTSAEEKNSVSIFEATRTDFRDESVYTLAISRFYDGDSGNNVYCWDDAAAGNVENNDPAWRGDFKGLIEKLDYIKALGFTAIRLNPVAQNVSNYDYHGEHPYNLSEIDFRLESDGITYLDLIDACHARGLKIMQNVVINHTSSFGEENLKKIFELNEETVWSITDSLIPTETLLEAYPDYLNMSTDEQGTARVDVLTGIISQSELLNTDKIYHNERSMSYASASQQQGTIALNCVDLNTENPIVALYLATTCAWYAQVGVDAICILSAEYISRWTLNEGILPILKDILAKSNLNTELFYEMQPRSRETWHYNIETLSVPFYSWAETNPSYQGNWDSTDADANVQKSLDHYYAHQDPYDAPTSTNALLAGLRYHTPDYSKSNGMHAFDFNLLWNFNSTNNAFLSAKANDKYMNDATWSLTSVDSWDYGPDGMDKTRYSGGVTGWMNNLNLLFTFRGIPSILYGTEIEFQKSRPLDLGTSVPLANTGHAYYGDNLEGTLTVTDFGEFTATGKIEDTLNSHLAKHIRKLNKLRQSVPALRKGQYTADTQYVSGNTAFIRRYTDAEQGIDSLALVTINGTATFKGIPNGTYINPLTGEKRTVTNGTLSATVASEGLAVYVCCANGFTGVDTIIDEPEHTLRFYANGGDGNITPISSTSTITLPECTFVAPEYSIFTGWNVNGTIYQSGDVVNIPIDSMARAVWYELPDLPEITFPTASQITYGETLSASTLIGGDTNYGTFTWKDASTIPTVTNEGYTVVFTPSQETIDSYKNVTTIEKTIDITVEKKTLTISAVDTTVCKDAEYTLTYATEGLFGEDNLTTAPTLTTNANIQTVGEYEISISGADAGDNYEIVYVGGKLTVTEHNLVDGKCDACDYVEPTTDPSTPTPSTPNQNEGEGETEFPDPSAPTPDLPAPGTPIDGTTTPADETKSDKDETKSDENENDTSANSGCGSSVALSALAIVVLGSAIVIKKKED